MNCKVHITETAESDLVEALDYIEFILLNTSASDRLLSDFEEAADSLASEPARFALVDDPVLRSWGIRLVTVSQYLLFYLIDSHAKTVYVVRFLHSRRDWSAILHDGISLM